jgi:sugar phosphate permease
MRVFILTWLSYASYYLTRKNFGVAKKAMMGEHNLSRQDLARIDSGYLGAYALGQFVWGALADVLGPRRIIAFGMVATALASLWFGSASMLSLLFVAWLMNGLVQATGWGANVKAMEQVPPSGRRGVVMGAWTTNYVIGGLVAGPVAAAFLHAYGLRGAFVGPAVIVVVVAVLVFFWLPEGRAGTAQARSRKVQAADVAAKRAERRAAVTQVLRTPRVWVLGASYFFMKLTRYAFLLWAVFYGETELGYSNAKATSVAMAFEAGGALGAISIGLASDRLFGGRRFPVAIGSLVCLAVSLVAYDHLSHTGVLSNVLGLAAIGFFLFGPDAILSGAAAQELGGPAAAATAAGIINGLGSIGPVFGSEFWTRFSTTYGWSAAFSLLGGGALVAALMLAPFWNVGRGHVIRE